MLSIELIIKLFKRDLTLREEQEKFLNYFDLFIQTNINSSGINYSVMLYNLSVNLQLWSQPFKALFQVDDKQKAVFMRNAWKKLVKYIQAHTTIEPEHLHFLWYALDQIKRELHEEAISIEKRDDLTNALIIGQSLYFCLYRPLDSLPDELLLAVLDYIPNHELNPLPRISKRFKDILSSNEFRKNRIKQYYPRSEATTFRQAVNEEYANTLDEIKKLHLLLRHKRTKQFLEHFRWQNLYQSHQNIMILHWLYKVDNQIILDHLYQLALNSVTRNGKLWLNLDIRLDPNRGTILIACVKFNQSLATLNSILSSEGLNINAVSTWNENALHYALRVINNKEQLSVVAALLAKHIDVNKRAKNDLTPLHLAVSHSSVEVIKLLLTYQAEVNAVATVEAITPLHLAVKRGDSRVVQVLLDAGALIEAPTSKEERSLHIAVYKRYAPIVQQFIAANADINAENGQNLTPLQLAAQAGNDEIVALLIAVSSIEVNKLTARYYSALYYAALEGHESTVRLLLKAGALPQQIDAMMPLHIAAYRGHIHVVRALINSGANCNISDNINNSTPLLCAVVKKHNDIVAFLIKYADTSLKGQKNYTPLQAAILTLNHEALSLLRHTNPTEANIDLLTSAAILNDIEYVKTVIEKEPNLLNELTLDENPLLFYAIQGNALDVVKLLIDFNVDVNKASGKNNLTPLLVAASGGHIEIVCLLISANAAINATCNEQKFTALHMAAQNGHKDIVSLLLKKGANQALKALALTSILMDFAKSKHSEKNITILLKGQKESIPEYVEYSALNLAVFFCHAEIVELLLQRVEIILEEDIQASLEIAIAMDDSVIIKLLERYLLQKGDSWLYADYSNSTFFSTPVSLSSSGETEYIPVSHSSH